MPPLHIDAQFGVVTVPRGLTIGPNLAQSTVRSAPAFAEARAGAYGAPPWIHYHLPGGQQEEREVSVRLCFHGETLVSVEIGVCPSGRAGWSDWSTAREADTKRYHDDLLVEMLGRPTERTAPTAHPFPMEDAVLAERLLWRLPWGAVSSAHDLRAGSTAIWIGYGDRYEAARRASIGTRRRE